jgi:formylglycine-generating enzyme required for sulfatase activity
MARFPVLVSLLLLAATAFCGAADRRVAPSPAQRRFEAAATPPGFVYVPGGWFSVGSDDPDADDDASPRRRAFVPSFYIGCSEVTHAEWKRFRPSHRIPPGHEAHPVTNVTLEEASAYCRWAGGRVPSDLEWEKAARGVDGRRYPWGNEFEPSRCNLGGRGAAEKDACLAPGARRGLRPADSLPAGASPYGTLHMAGNAWEWVADAYQGDPQKRIIRGGAYGYGERAARTYHRGVEGAGVT